MRNPFPSHKAKRKKDGNTENLIAFSIGRLKATWNQLHSAPFFPENNSKFKSILWK